MKRRRDNPAAPRGDVIQELLLFGGEFFAAEFPISLCFVHCVIAPFTACITFSANSSSERTASFCLSNRGRRRAVFRNRQCIRGNPADPRLPSPAFPR